MMSKSRNVKFLIALVITVCCIVYIHQNSAESITHVITFKDWSIIECLLSILLLALVIEVVYFVLLILVFLVGFEDSLILIRNKKKIEKSRIDEKSDIKSKELLEIESNLEKLSKNFAGVLHENAETQVNATMRKQSNLSSEVGKKPLSYISTPKELIEKVNEDLNSVNYAVEDRFTKINKEGYYPIVIAPQINSTFLKPTYNSTKKPVVEGVTEVDFVNRLYKSFRAQLRKNANLPVPGSREGRVYTPDALLIRHKTRLVIEIDEPYTGIARKPTHYINSYDVDRNQFFSSNGYIVVRFAEKQIVEEQEACIYFIIDLLRSIDVEFNPSSNAEVEAWPSLIKQWSMEEAIEMAEENYREQYLNIQFPQEKSKDDSEKKVIEYDDVSLRKEKPRLEIKDNVQFVKRTTDRTPVQNTTANNITFDEEPPLIITQVDSFNELKNLIHYAIIKEFIFKIRYKKDSWREADTYLLKNVKYSEKFPNCIEGVVRKSNYLSTFSMKKITAIQVFDVKKLNAEKAKQKKQKKSGGCMVLFSFGIILAGYISYLVF